MRKKNQQEMLEKREAYAAFEKTILDLYERDELTLNQLDLTARQYRHVAIDSAGSLHQLTHDQKDLFEVCIELVDPSFSIPARGSHEDHEEYWEKELKKWEDIVRWRWGWYAYNTSRIDQQQSEKAA